MLGGEVHGGMAEHVVSLNAGQSEQAIRRV